MRSIHRAAARLAIATSAALCWATHASAQLNLPDLLPLDPAMAGPDLLRAPSPRAPQLENTGVARAAPILVCHASAYRAGEYVHQGCVYDDQGAQLVPTNWPDHSITFAYRYPTAEAYRQNAADLLEVRVKPLSDATAIRITYNTMRPGAGRRDHRAGQQRAAAPRALRRQHLDAGGALRHRARRMSGCGQDRMFP